MDGKKKNFQQIAELNRASYQSSREMRNDLELTTVKSKKEKNKQIYKELFK